MRILNVTDRAGAVVEPEWLLRAQAVHRQLRPQLPADYDAKMRRVFAGGGRMVVAVQDNFVLGVAVYRCHENTAEGFKCYVDDLVTDEGRRSQGIGRVLLAHVAHEARAQGCEQITLDSGVQRGGAHRFYFREGFVIASFNFKRPIQ
jgi:GNAT superfamily N-acetyltransferase